MKRIEFNVVTRDNGTESRTAYILPELVSGFRFVVTRDDNSSGRYKWSISQYDTGLGVGNRCQTRQDAISAFRMKMDQMISKQGDGQITTHIQNAINDNRTLNS